MYLDLHCPRHCYIITTLSSTNEWDPDNFVPLQPIPFVSCFMVKIKLLQLQVVSLAKLSRCSQSNHSFDVISNHVKRATICVIMLAWPSRLSEP